MEEEKKKKRLFFHTAKHTGHRVYALAERERGTPPSTSAAVSRRLTAREGVAVIIVVIQRGAAGDPALLELASHLAGRGRGLAGCLFGLGGLTFRRHFLCSRAPLRGLLLLGGCLLLGGRLGLSLVCNNK
jgi:hypothetical protein